MFDVTSNISVHECKKGDGFTLELIALLLINMGNIPFQKNF